MEILDKADELGKLIGESSHLLRYRNAQTALLNNNELCHKLNEYKEMYNSYLKDKDQSLKERIDSMFEEININPIYSEFVISKEQFDEMMDTVDALLKHRVNDEYTGYEEKTCCSSKGCSTSDCSSRTCSGCGSKNN